MTTLLIVFYISYNFLQLINLRFLIIAVIIFALVQIVYISAFGFKPFEHGVGCIVFSVELIVYTSILPYIRNEVFLWLFPVYITLLFTMIWRSVALLNFKDDVFFSQRVFGAIGENIIKKYVSHSFVK